MRYLTFMSIQIQAANKEASKYRKEINYVQLTIVKLPDCYQAIFPLEYLLPSYKHSIHGYHGYHDIEVKQF